MTAGVILGVVGCVLPFAMGIAVNENYPDISAKKLFRVVWLTAAIHWTALIVWLVMR
jgi:hypothetical protein